MSSGDGPCGSCWTRRRRPAAVRRIGEQLGINPETLRGWVNQAEVDAGERPGTSTSDAQRLIDRPQR